MTISVPKTSFWRGDKAIASRYRALKKLAIDSRDHTRELEFFAGEMKHRRGNDDPINSVRYFLNLGYELFSDFGRSALRPLTALFFLQIIFANFYLFWMNLTAWLNCGPDGLLPIGEALYLSFAHSVPFIGLRLVEQIKLVSHCLYGSEVLPLGITVLATFQTILSTVLVFLFLLAVRNYLRLK